MTSLQHDSIWMRRAIFLGLNAAIAIALANLLIVPLCAFFADRDARIGEQQALLARLQAVAAQRERVQAIAQETEAQAGSGEFLTGANDGVLSADLQARLKGLVESTGAHVRSVQSLPGRTKDQIKYVGSRIDMHGSIQAVHRAIYAVESGKPYLFVVNAVIKPAPMSNRPGVIQEPVIEAQLDVFGALRIDGADQ
jgi:general secretion pathway protein M